MNYDKEKARFYAFTEMKLGRNAAEIHRALSEVWLDLAPSYATVKNWLADFKSGGRTSFEDQPRTGRPLSAGGDDRTEDVLSLVSEDPHVTVREISIETGIPGTCVWRILTDVLQFHNVAAFWVPAMLTAQQMEQRRQQAAVIRDRLLDLGDQRYDIYTIVDETWIRYDLEFTQRDARAWIPAGAARPQVPVSKLTPRKCLLIIAFTCSKRFSVQALPYGRSLDSEAYVEFVQSTGNKWRSLRSNPIHLKDLVWQHDNARPHVKQSVQDFFAKRHVELLHQPTYSPDLNLCDRWLNNHLKNCLRKIEFEDTAAVEAAALKCLRETEMCIFRKELDKLISHCEKVIACGGNYVTPA